MQKILKTSIIANERAKIPVLGREVYLKAVSVVSGTPDEGVIGIETFKGSGIQPPCVTIWYDEIVASTGDRQEFIIHSLEEIGTKLFGMTAEDADILANYILDIAAQLRIEVILLENAVVFVSKIIQDKARAGETWKSVQEEAKTNRDIAVALGSMGAATILGKAIELGMKKYDQINYYGKADAIANIVKKCRHIGPDGLPTPLNIQEAEDLLNIAKSKLYIAQ